MDEVGKVVAVEGEYVKLILKRREACGKCRACSAGLSEKEMEMKAKNLCGAKKGDKVEIFIEHSNFMKAVLIMYGIPCLCFLAGILAGYYGAVIAGFEAAAPLVGIGLAVILTAAAFILIHLNEKNWSSGQYMPVASRIAERSEE